MTKPGTFAPKFLCALLCGLACILAPGGFFAGAGQAHAQMQLSSDTPAVGDQVTITVAEPVSEWKATYRPNSGVVEEVSSKLDGPSTTFTWTPDRAGIVQLSAGSATRNVSVRFSSFPVLGMIIMLIAAGVLFGGAAFAFRMLFRRGPGSDGDDGELGYDPSIAHHPDT